MLADIAVVLYDGFDEMDAIAPYEVFANAQRAARERRATEELRIRYVTLEARERVTASHGTRIEPDATLADAYDADLVVIPGGGWNDRSPESAWAEAKKGDLPEALADLHAAGTPLAAVCTGGMLLERAGVLDGRPAVTHGGAMNELRKSAADVVEARVVDDGDVVTAGGVTSGLDLAFHVVAREFGDDIARQVSEEMEYEPSSDVFVG